MGGSESSQVHNRNQENIIEVRSLYSGYPVRSGMFGTVSRYATVLQDINLSIPRGSTLGLVGESGSGKTTLGRAILGLAPVIQGSVVYHTKTGNPVDLTEQTEKGFRRLRKELQIIFQDPFSSLNPRLTVGEHMMESVRLHFHKETRDQQKERSILALEQCGLSGDIFRRYPHEFSGGQRQRISIARAIVTEPDFIVCDESVSALDVSVQAQIINLLIDLQDNQGISYLFISHDLSVVRHISHDIAVLHNGVVVEYNDARQIMENPRHDYTKTLIQAIPRVNH